MIPALSFELLMDQDEGLREHGGAIEQLPSFITNIPTGREIVSRHTATREDTIS
jgi:hypothetical protein